MSSLPSPDTSVHVYALPTGRLYLPDRWLFEDGDEDIQRARQLSPDFSFLISHPTGGHVLFDLGLRKDFDGNPTVIRADYPYISPIVTADAAEILQRGHIQPSTVSTVVFSHLHFDHVGDPTTFSHATFIAGPGSREATAPGYPKNTLSPFLSAIIDHEKYHELSFEKDCWVPVGSFERGYDYFGDGSFYLLDAPGHMPGHLSGLAHTGEDEWILMGGDCCHHRALLVGARPVSVTVGPNGTRSFHKDPPSAISTIERIRALENHGSVLVALAHDAMLEGRMPEYPAKLNGWKQSLWKQEIDAAVQAAYP
ncbi:Metallo-hydrolase/oxidoreductase [Thozetella sp. PMI_491]|nr:Metallo-hydrolase/oxidoreductase [Thozetella sp. PMI_491]